MRTARNPTYHLPAALVAIGILAAAVPADVIPSHARALTGVTGVLGPGLDGLTFVSVSVASVDGNGGLAFGGTLAGADVTPANDQGLWHGDQAGNEVLAREGDLAPGYQVGTYGQFTMPFMSRYGVAVFTAAVAGISPNATVTGVWSNRTGPLTKIAEGTNFPFTAPNQFRGVGTYFLGDDGLVTINAQDDVNSSYPAQESATAPPSRPPGLVFNVPTGRLLYTSGIVANSSQAVFAGTYRNTAGQTGGGLWTLSAGSVSEVVLTGASASGGLVFCSFDVPAVNSRGDIVFAAALGPLNQPPQTDALFRVGAGSLSRVLTGGDPAPDRPLGTVFHGIGSPIVNAQGVILFRTQTDQSLDETWKAGANDQLACVLAAGQLLPELGAGISVGNQSNPSMNGLGYVAIRVNLVGTGVTSSNDLTILVIAPNGEVRVVARKGMPMSIGGGLTKTPTTLDFLDRSGGGDGRGTALGDDGTLAYRAVFSDGSQAVLAASVLQCGSADFNCDGDSGTDADIESFFACLAGNCPPPPCTSTADFNGDGDTGTDADIESFFRVLAGGNC